MSHVGASALVDRGILAGNQAWAADRAAAAGGGEACYREAKELYVSAASALSAAARATPDAALTRLCFAKCQEYVARAEEIHEWIERNEAVKRRAEEDAAAAAAADRKRRNAEKRGKGSGKGGKGTAARKKTGLGVVGGGGGGGDGGGGGGGGGGGRGRGRGSGSGGPGGCEEDPDPDPSNGDGDAGGPGTGEGGGEDSESSTMRKALLAAVVTETPNVHWGDVAGLTGAKDALKEAVILPKKFPGMFVGERRPWRGILMYGPPGTGKSYLAKAVATEADSYFISVSSSDLVSKWQGDSEKLVKELFVLAREMAPTVIFIDEIDSLVSSRSDNESESSRRIKTEFLVQMDGVGNGTDGVLVLGATNIPWGLDDALLRRMERRVYIPLPDRSGRLHMLRLHLGDTPHSLTDENFVALADVSEGYSGSDLKTVCRDAIMHPVRLATGATHFKKVIINGEEKVTPCSPGDPLAEELEGGIMSIKSTQLLLPPVSCAHFEMALHSSKPSVGADNIKKHQEFTDTKGQEGR